MEMTTSGLVIGRLLLFTWLSTPNDPPADEWDAALDSMNARLARDGIGMDDVRMLVITDGGAPNGVQRARLGREFGCKACIITTVLSNPIKRGIATALSWLNPKTIFCEPHQAAHGLAHLDLAPHWGMIESNLAELQRALPLNKTLELTKKELALPIQP